MSIRPGGFQGLSIMSGPDLRRSTSRLLKIPLELKSWLVHYTQITYKSNETVANGFFLSRSRVRALDYLVQVKDKLSLVKLTPCNADGKHKNRSRNTYRQSILFGRVYILRLLKLFKHGFQSELQACCD